MGLVRQINVGSDVGYLWPYTPKAVSVTSSGRQDSSVRYALIGPIDGIYYVYNKYWGDLMDWTSASKLTQVVEVNFENGMRRPHMATIMPQSFWITLKNNSVNWHTEEKPSNYCWFWTSTFGYSNGDNDFYVDWDGNYDDWNYDDATYTGDRARLGFYV